MQRITLSPASIAARVLVATRAESSWKMVRRSEWPERDNQDMNSYLILWHTKNDVGDPSVDQLLRTRSR